MADDRRIRSVRLNASPRLKPPRPKSPKRPRKPRAKTGPAAALYWLAALLVVLLLALVAAYIEAPEIKAWLAGTEPPAGKFPLEPLPGPPSPHPHPHRPSARRKSAGASWKKRPPKKRASSRNAPPSRS